MKEPDKYDENDMPWDVKTVKIELGGHGDEWLEVEVFDDKQFRITFKNVDIFGLNDGLTEEEMRKLTAEEMREITVEEMHMDVARRLRDFLNYAVPNVEGNAP